MWKHHLRSAGFVPSRAVESPKIIQRNMSVFKGYQLQPKYTDEEIKKRRRARELAAAAADTGPDGAAANQPPPSPEPAPNNRMLDARWCDCGQCKEVPKNATLGMCICCQEQDFEGLRDKLDGPNHIVPCITRHEDFKAISLTEAVLQMMEAYTRQQRGYGVREGWTNRYV